MFRQAISLEPRNPSLLTSFAEVNMGLGRLDEAEKLAERARQIDPDSYMARLLAASQNHRQQCRGREKKPVGLPHTDPRPKSAVQAI